ncbi:MAG: CoA transferase, partial [Synergistaceae bacterium]|jgi:CoA:oxalate CoA-transferase|nr:CoA transferase [Synergistaceae bacterium]
MGADVIKVENPVGGDDSRAFGPFKNGVSAYYMGLNRSKRSVTLNLKSAEGKEILKKLVEKSDVLLENYKPGTMKKLGLDYETLKKTNPGIVYAASSGFGQTGPYGSRAAYDLIVQGMSGFMSITGFDAEHPVKAGSSIADIFAGVFTAIGVLAALEHKRKTGEGQMVDVAMLDCMVSILENAIATYDCTGKSPAPIGNVNRSITPFATFPTADGLVNICAGNDELWRKFCVAAGMEEYIEDERFADNLKRGENFGTLFGIMSERLRTKTTAEWMDALEAVKVPCGAILNVEQVVNDPQVKAREMIVEMDHPDAGKIIVPGVPIKFSATPASIKSPAPRLGEHNEEIYGQLLGMDREELTKLKEEGVL